METTIRQSAGDKGLPMTTTSLADTACAQCKRLHVKSRCDEGWYIFDHDLSGDVETSERAAFDWVSKVIRISRVDRKDLIVSHIHVWAEKVQQHMPCPNEAGLIDTGEESCEVLVDEDEVTVEWSCLKNREECVNIP